MPPLLPISDLSWIAIFQEFTPNDQLVASKMSLRCAVLVRAANRKVKSLVITDKDFKDPSNLDKVKDKFNYYSLSSKPAMKQLMNIPGEPPFLDYPITTTSFSKWNVLQLNPLRLYNTSTIKQIVNIFSAVTDLKFIFRYSVPVVALLDHPNWRCQLTNLMVDRTRLICNPLAHELISAINDLTALQHLALRWGSNIDLPNLTILAQLKVVALQSDNLHAFVRSLEQYATDNLQVHLISADTESLLKLSQPLHSRIVRFDKRGRSFNRDQVPLLCSQFRSLTSLSIYGIDATDVGPLFTALSQLHQLVILKLKVYLGKDVELSVPRPQAKINSLRALDLNLLIESHSAVEWLNLPWTMPSLQTIYSQDFLCRSCKIAFNGLNSSSLSLLNSPSALNCFQSSLFTFHSGVPLNRVILGFPGKAISAENLLLQSVSEPPVTAEQP